MNCSSQASWFSWSPRVCSNSRPSSLNLFPSCPQSFPASRTFLMSYHFTSGGQNIGPSATASVLPMQSQGWFPLWLTGLISFSPRDSQESSPASQFQSISSSALSLLYGPTNTCTCESESRSVMSDSLPPHGLYSQWNSPGQNTGVCSLSLLQGIFPIQGLNSGLPHCKQISYSWSTRKVQEYWSW